MRQWDTTSPSQNGRSTLRKMNRILRIMRGQRPANVPAALNERALAAAIKSGASHYHHLHPTKGYRRTRAKSMFA